MKRLFFLLIFVAIVSACGSTHQFAVNAIYDARVRLSIAEQAGAQQVAPEAVTEAQDYLTDAEVALAEGEEEAALRLSHYAHRTADLAILLVQQKQAERSAQIAAIDFAEAQAKEERAFKARQEAEEELAQSGVQ